MQTQSCVSALNYTTTSNNLPFILIIMPRQKNLNRQHDDHLDLDNQHDDNLYVDGQHEHARAQERDARGAHAVEEAEVQPEKSTLTR